MSRRRDDEDDEVANPASRKLRLSINDFNEPNTDRIEEDDYDDIDIDKDSIDEDAYNDDEHPGDNDGFKNKLLFAVQGLGSTKLINMIPVYVRGTHCEDSLKEILQILQLFEEKSTLDHRLRIELGKWEVLQKDLLSLLVLQHEDKKLTFYVLALLVELTTLPKEYSEDKDAKNKEKKNEDKKNRENQIRQELIGYLQV